MSWVSPTGFNDPDTQWSDEPNAYDKNVGTQAKDNVSGNSWGSFLELTHAAILCDKVQFYAPYSSSNQSSIDLDVYYDGGWHDVYEGIYTNNAWVEKALGATYSVTAARVKFYNNFFLAYDLFLNEFNFNVFEGVTHELTATTASVIVTDSSLTQGRIELMAATAAINSSLAALLTSGKIETLVALVAAATNIPSIMLRLLFSITAHAPPAISTQGSLIYTAALSSTAPVVISTQGSLTVGGIKPLTASPATSISTQGSLTRGKTEALTATTATSISTQGSLTIGKVEALTATTATVISIEGSLTFGKIELLNAISNIQSAIAGELSGVRILFSTSSAITSISGSLRVINLVNRLRKLIQLLEIKKW